MEFRKMVMMTLYARQQKRHRCKEQTFGLCGSVRISENSIGTGILPYVKYVTSPGLMHETGRSGPVHWDDPEEWDAEGGGRGFRNGDTCTRTADSCQCMAKPTTIL